MNQGEDLVMDLGFEAVCIGVSKVSLGGYGDVLETKCSLTVSKMPPCVCTQLHSRVAFVPKKADTFSNPLQPPTKTTN